MGLPVILMPFVSYAGTWRSSMSYSWMPIVQSQTSCISFRYFLEYLILVLITRPIVFSSKVGSLPKRSNCEFALLMKLHIISCEHP